MARALGFWVVMGIGLLVTVAGCDRPGATSVTAATAQTELKASEAKAAKGVSKIVFLDQEACCDCTRKRIDGSWAELQAAFGGTPAIPIERIHWDTQEDAAKVYQDKRAVMVMPGIYFLDDTGGIVELLQGEVTREQISKVLQAS